MIVAAVGDPHPSRPGAPGTVPNVDRRNRRRRGLVAAGVTLATGGAGLALGATEPVAATTLTVTSTDDAGPGSLRAALADAVDGDVVDLTGVTGTIVLSTGPLVIDHTVTIVGPGDDRLTVSGGGTDRVLVLDPSVTGTGTVTVRGLTIADGYADADPLQGGGGILFSCGFNSATSLVLDDVTLTRNRSVYLGAGLYFDECNSGGEYGNLVVTGSTISGNTSYYSGAGGVWFDSGAEIVVADTVIAGNASVGWSAAGLSVSTGHHATVTGSRITGNTNYYLRGGGAEFGAIDTVITGTTIADNRTTKGGGAGVHVLGNYLRTFTVRDSTIAHNVARYYGGALYVEGAASAVVLENSTISGNEAAQAGAVYGGLDGIRMVQSTVTANVARAPSAGVPVGGVLLSGPVGAGDVCPTARPRGAAPGVAARRSGAVAARQGAIRPSTCAAVGVEPDGTLDLVGTVLAGNVGTDVGRWRDGAVALRSDHSVVGTVEPTVAVSELGGSAFGVTDPGLQPLADNGGPTATHALRSDSPALDAGPDPVPAFPGNDHDQRGTGYARVVNGLVDVGAYEAQGREPNFTG